MNPANPHQPTRVPGFAPEADLNMAREWLEFYDPGDDHHLITVDLTWLQSHWSCQFGTAQCHGLDATRPWAGCCIHGAFLTDDDDRATVVEAVEKFLPGEWQLAEKTAQLDAADPEDTPEFWLEWDELDNDEGESEPALRTRLHDGLCVFFNRPDHPQGAGCALHQMAMRRGESLVENKPEVCWQVPLRRLQDYEDRPDGEEILHTTIGEYDRRAWGSGGLDHPWWCTGAPEAHGSGTPIWRSHADELTALIGETGYAELVRLCRQREEEAAAMGLAGRILPLFTPHPATVAAQAATQD